MRKIETHVAWLRTLNLFSLTGLRHPFLTPPKHEKFLFHLDVRISPTRMWFKENTTWDGEKKNGGGEHKVETQKAKWKSHLLFLNKKWHECEITLEEIFLNNFFSPNLFHAASSYQGSDEKKKLSCKFWRQKINFALGKWDFSWFHAVRDFDLNSS